MFSIAGSIASMYNVTLKVRRHSNGYTSFWPMIVSWSVCLAICLFIDVPPTKPSMQLTAKTLSSPLAIHVFLSSTSRFGGFNRLAKQLAVTAYPANFFRHKHNKNMCQYVK